MPTLINIIYMWVIFYENQKYFVNCLQRRWSMHILEIVSLMLREQVGFEPW